jgi:hypothetical protein
MTHTYQKQTPTAERVAHFSGDENQTRQIKLNGTFFTLCAILRFIIASTAEAELGALILNCKQVTIF